MKKMKELCCCCAALIFWGVGAILLRQIWNYQKSLPDPLGAYIEFIIMFLATFYILALFPIKRCVNRFFDRIATSFANYEGF